MWDSLDLKTVFSRVVSYTVEIIRKLISNFLFIDLYNAHQENEFAVYLQEKGKEKNKAKLYLTPRSDRSKQ